LATTSIILVVEDNSTEQYILKLLIQKFDYDVHVVASGEEALAALGLAKYAAILMDISLPGIDGYECTKRIRRMELESGRRTPVIALTARTENTAHDAAKKAGMDDFLSKPFEPEELRKTLLRYVYDPSQPNLKTLSPLPSADSEPSKKDIQ
jgi:CheY-like chemotaxis protein